MSTCVAVARSAAALAVCCLQMLQRAHALNPLKLNTMESLVIAYEFIKKPEQVKAIKQKIRALREKYPDLPKGSDLNT